MYSARTIAEIASHRAWLAYSWAARWTWQKTGWRRRFLSSKGQDRWVSTTVFPASRKRFFLEVGAGDGFTGSDTFVLERDHGWNGICVEANPALFATMVHVVKRNCICVNACISDTEAEVLFACAGDTSGIVADDTDNCEEFRARRLRKLRAIGRVLVLPGRPILDILDAYKAPNIIDYVSIDTEGTEERIIRSFPFERYKVLSLTVERPTARIHALLCQIDLVLVRHHFNDGFYVHRAVLPATCQEVNPVFRRKRF
jgi:FkbM family methyltransferase